MLRASKQKKALAIMCWPTPLSARGQKVDVFLGPMVPIPPLAEIPVARTVRKAVAECRVGRIDLETSMRRTVADLDNRQTGSCAIKWSRAAAEPIAAVALRYGICDDCRQWFRFRAIRHHFYASRQAACMQLKLPVWRRISTKIPKSRASAASGLNNETIRKCRLSASIHVSGAASKNRILGACPTLKN